MYVCGYVAVWVCNSCHFMCAMHTRDASLCLCFLWTVAFGAQKPNAILIPNNKHGTCKNKNSVFLQAASRTHIMITIAIIIVVVIIIAIFPTNSRCVWRANISIRFTTQHLRTACRPTSSVNIHAVCIPYIYKIHPVLNGPEMDRNLDYSIQCITHTTL